MEYVQVDPATQVVAPFHPTPPHWPHLTCEAPVGDAVAMVVVEVLLTALLVVSVVGIATQALLELEPGVEGLSGLEKHPFPVQVKSNHLSTSVAFVWMLCVTFCALTAMNFSP